MYQTQILEDLEFAISRCDKDKAPLYYAAMISMYRLIPKVPTFHFGDVKGINTVKLDPLTPLFRQYPEYNRFPYNSCLFEGYGFGDTHTKTEYPAKKRAVYIDSDKNFAVITLMHIIDGGRDDEMNNRWVLEPFMGILRIGTGEEIEENSYLKVVSNYSPDLHHHLLSLELGEVKTIPWINAPDIAYDTWLKDSGADMTFVKKALLLMHCKNIIKEEVKPPEKLNKKRLKNNKLPFYSFHVLKVVIPSSKGSSNKKSVTLGTAGTHRLNFCHGHFKHYTADKPLFGKWTGLWWWDDYARGNPSKGIVEKEYLIIKGKEHETE